MAHKKIVFVIVEGPSDQDALELLLTKIFSNNKLYVHVMHGDITSDYDNNASNIIRKVTQEIKNYAENYHFKRIHFERVIHLVDMDGAYISEDDIIEDPNASGVIYSTDNIITNNKCNIIERNHIKTENINKLSETPKVWGNIPYNLYYMSSNLDHVLYNKMNSTDDEKEIDAHRFIKEYKSNVEEFKKFIVSSDFSVNDDFISTWKFIKVDKHSLQRHTNLGLCFPQ